MLHVTRKKNDSRSRAAKEFRRFSEWRFIIRRCRRKRGSPALLFPTYRALNDFVLPTPYMFLIHRETSRSIGTAGLKLKKRGSPVWSEKKPAPFGGRSFVIRRTDSDRVSERRRIGRSTHIKHLLLRQFALRLNLAEYTRFLQTFLPRVWTRVFSIQSKVLSSENY